MRLDTHFLAEVASIASRIGATGVEMKLVRLNPKKKKKKPRPTAERLTPPEVAKRYGVSADTVRKWIEDGELAAVNVANPKAKRPRYRIEPQALAAFDQRRAAKTVSPPPKRRKKAEPKLLVTRFSQ